MNPPENKGDVQNSSALAIEEILVLFGISLLFLCFFVAISPAQSACAGIVALFIMMFLAWAFSATFGEAQKKDEVKKQEDVVAYDKQIAPKADLITLSPVPDRQENAYTHAIRATQKAGVNPNWASVLPIDMGLIAFHDETRTVYRVASLPKSAQYLQPFVKLHVRHAKHKRIRFEIKDNHDTTVLKFGQEYVLKIGENFITPPTRLAITELANITGIWNLWVYEDNEPLAIHQFGWEGESGGVVTMPISQDGEINSELTDELESQFGTISLDDLLGDSDQSVQKGKH